MGTIRRQAVSPVKSASERPMVSCLTIDLMPSASITKSASETEPSMNEMVVPASFCEIFVAVLLSSTILGSISKTLSVRALCKSALCIW